MAQLFSRYESGLQFTDGAMTGSIMGVSGINPIVDRLNSITSDNNVVSGTQLIIYVSGGNLVGGAGNHYWSCPGINFVANDYNTEYVSYDLETGKLIVETLLGTAVLAPVTGIPEGAIITAAGVFGNAGASNETWELNRVNIITCGATNLASANVNSLDTSISYAEVINMTYGYFFSTSVLSQNDEIQGGWIRYTT